ncbi:MAG: SdrD B-like domain-containing protein, partial [Chloroflexota bacterium]
MSVILSLTLMLMVSVSGVAQAAGIVSGHVFRDYNANGIQDTDEPNVAGVTINAYGSTGAIVGTTISTATVPPANPLTTTNYTINWLGPDTRVRLEFTGLPGIAEQGAFALGTSAGSGTSIQFVDAGANPVNYGINRPSD